MLARLGEPALEGVGLEHADLLVEAVEEAHVARLVGDLRAEEDAHLLGRRRAHHRPELLGHLLLADEERAEPVHPLEALLLRDALVPVDPVLREVDVLGGPLLALPEVVQLRVAEQVDLAAVGRLHHRRVAGRLEVVAQDPIARRLAHGAQITPWLAGQPNYRSTKITSRHSPSRRPVAKVRSDGAKAAPRDQPHARLVGREQLADQLVEAPARRPRPPAPRGARCPGPAPTELRGRRTRCTRRRPRRRRAPLYSDVAAHPATRPSSSATRNGCRSEADALGDLIRLPLARLERRGPLADAGVVDLRDLGGVAGSRRADLHSYGPGSAVAEMRTWLPAPWGRPTIDSPGRRPSIVVEVELI